MSETSLFLVSYAPLPAPVTAICTFTHLYQCPYYMANSAPYVYCLFPLPKDIVLTTLWYKHTLSQYTERNSGSKKKHTLKNSRCHFCFLFSLVIGIDFFSVIKVVKIAKYQSARETIKTSSTKHSNLCVFKLCFRA